MQQIVTQVRTRKWLEMIHAQKESGLSIQRWCKENNISENCYYYRKSKLREIAGSGLTQFIDITRPAQEAVSGTYIENHINSTAVMQIGTVKVSLTNEAGEELIRRILRSVNA